jgi:hypothetical protein
MNIFGVESGEVPTENIVLLAPREAKGVERKRTEMLTARNILDRDVFFCCFIAILQYYYFLYYLYLLKVKICPFSPVFLKNARINLATGIIRNQYFLFLKKTADG